MHVYPDHPVELGEQPGGQRRVADLADPVVAERVGGSDEHDLRRRRAPDTRPSGCRRNTGSVGRAPCRCRGGPACRAYGARTRAPPSRPPDRRWPRDRLSHLPAGSGAVRQARSPGRTSTIRGARRIRQSAATTKSRIEVSPAPVRRRWRRPSVAARPARPSLGDPLDRDPVVVAAVARAGWIRAGRCRRGQGARVAQVGLLDRVGHRGGVPATSTTANGITSRSHRHRRGRPDRAPRGGRPGVGAPPSSARMEVERRVGRTGRGDARRAVTTVPTRCRCRRDRGRSTCPAWTRIAWSSSAVAGRRPYQISEKTSTPGSGARQCGGTRGGDGASSVTVHPGRTDDAPLDEIPYDRAQPFPHRLGVAARGGELVGGEGEHLGRQIRQFVVRQLGRPALGPRDAPAAAAPPHRQRNAPSRNRPGQPVRCGSPAAPAPRQRQCHGSQAGQKYHASATSRRTRAGQEQPDVGTPPGDHWRGRHEPRSRRVIAVTGRRGRGTPARCAVVTPAAQGAAQRMSRPSVRIRASRCRATSRQPSIG